MNLEYSICALAPIVLLFVLSSKSVVLCQHHQPSEHVKLIRTMISTTCAFRLLLAQQNKTNWLLFCVLVVQICIYCFPLEWMIISRTKEISTAIAATTVAEDRKWNSTYNKNQFPIISAC